MLPQAAFASLRQEVTEDLIVFLDLLWADFSDFDIIQLDLSTGTSLSPATHFSDTIGYGIAAEYRLSPDWTVSAGVSYASSPVRSRNRNAALPFDRQVRYGAGVRYGWSEDLILAFSYEYLDLGDNKLSNSLGGGTLSGDYSDNYAHFFVLSFSKAF